MRRWLGSNRGNYHLYGHSHGSLPDDPNSLSIDVGVDCHNYKPISADRVRDIMRDKIKVMVESKNLMHPAAGK
jgi:calcineurin-like phosphoesterase family protein